MSIQKHFKFTKAEADHILTVIGFNEREGNYYAPREEYWNRSNRIKKKLLEMFPELKKEYHVPF